MAKISELTDEQLEKNIKKFKNKVKAEPDVEKHKLILKKLKNEFNKRQTGSPVNQEELAEPEISSKERKSYELKAMGIVLGIFIISFSALNLDIMVAILIALAVSYFIKLRCPRCGEKNAITTFKCSSCGSWLRSKKVKLIKSPKVLKVFLPILLGFILIISLFPNILWNSIMLSKIDSKPDLRTVLAPQIEKCKEECVEVTLKETDFKTKKIESVQKCIRVFPLMLTQDNKKRDRIFLYNQVKYGEDVSKFLKNNITALCMDSTKKKGKPSVVCFNKKDIKHSALFLRSAMRKTTKSCLWKTMFEFKP